MKYKLGDWVVLNSGGEPMMVVDIHPTEEKITVAWKTDDGIEETKLPEVCVKYK